MEAFSQLPAAQYSTGWVLCCIGRAYYEMVDYPQAARVFEWARQVDPTRLEVWPLSFSSSPWVLLSEGDGVFLWGVLLAARANMTPSHNVYSSQLVEPRAFHSSGMPGHHGHMVLSVTISHHGQQVMVGSNMLFWQKIFQRVMGYDTTCPTSPGS